MPSFADSIFLFVLALILFGPKKLPELARTLGKLMAEFRRASNEFKYQMEEELRVTELNERQKEIEKKTPEAEPDAVKPIAQEGELTIMPPSTGLPIGAETEAPAVTSAEQATAAATAAGEHDAVTPLVDSIPDEFNDEHANQGIPQHTHSTQESHG